MHKKRRLLKLADLVEQTVKVEPEFQFDQDFWGTLPARPRKNIFCGTTACMMGVAALSGKFHRHGLRYYIQPGHLIKIYTINGADNAFDSAEEIFGLTGDESRFLFGSFPSLKGKRGARKAVARLRRFVDEGGMFDD